MDVLLMLCLMYALQDMNEPANFGTNEERPFNWPEDALPYWSLKCPRSDWDDPPYKPGDCSKHHLSRETILFTNNSDTFV